MIALTGVVLPTVCGMLTIAGTAVVSTTTGASTTGMGVERAGAIITLPKPGVDVAPKENGAAAAFSADEPKTGTPLVAPPKLSGVPEVAAGFPKRPEVATGVEAPNAVDVTTPAPNLAPNIPELLDPKPAKD